MDYRTLSFTYLAFLTVYAVCAGMLAHHNRRVHGLSWIAAGLFVNLLKVVLQGLEGHIPTIGSALIANELYLVSFILQMIGLRWFVTRTPFRWNWMLTLISSLVGLYTVLYVFRVSYIANLINIPVAAVIGATAYLLFQRGRGLFLSVSRWTAAALVGEMLVSLYKGLLTNLYYAQPWKVVNGQHDPRRIYSLLAMMVCTTCVIMCSFWFFVVELQSELVKQARTDPLTGALNRRALFDEADREIARSLRSGQPLCVLLLDVDDFKRVNDTHGHAGGDHVLKEFVLCARNTLRITDLLARTGGEEFTVVLPDTGRDFAIILAERLHSQIEKLAITFSGSTIHISVSIGVAELFPSCSAFETLLHRADLAMYQAKMLGKNRTIVYSNRIIPVGTAQPQMLAAAQFHRVLGEL